jgi:hypothetical protein
MGDSWNGQGEAFEQPSVALPRQLLLATAIERPIPEALCLLVEGVGTLAQEKAAHLGLRQAGERGRLRGPSQRSPICAFLLRTMGDFSVIAKDLLPAHAWDALAKTRQW